ncbi:hypothetical protein RRF57_000486 [Xylaria bambusicola]|uniref:Uncharacterized protein n=1 Tax=Xylaria bambusicola TaxID=326684 RepID=A0AAN7YU77_9PEZI
MSRKIGSASLSPYASGKGEASGNASPSSTSSSSSSSSSPSSSVSKSPSRTSTCATSSSCPAPLRADGSLSDIFQKAVGPAGPRGSKSLQILVVSDPSGVIT